VHDGAGIRTVVFFKGCPLRCGWCHSPETQALDAEVVLQQDRCVGCGACADACAESAAAPAAGAAAVDRARCVRCGQCADACPSGARAIVGAWMSVDDVMGAIRRDVPFYDGSGGGVTFSGGEPLLQPSFLEALLARCRAEGIETAIETCGYASRRTMLRIAPLVSSFLFDVKIADEGRHRGATGVSSRPIVANLHALAARRAPVVVRFPLIPGVTDDDANVRAVGALVASLRLPRIDVLPYHRMGSVKYERLGRPYAFGDVPAPSGEAVEAAAALLRAFGLDVRTGG
jgi:pyruvate formate lyase activating enzyme